MLRLALALAVLPAAAGPAAAQPSFTPADIAGWKPHSFKGWTRYELVRVDGRDALHASCSASASGLVLERTIDLRETPVLEWSWRVDSTFAPDIDETTRAGDDYAARVYVVQDGGLLAWRTRAVNYVWASAQPPGSDWPNAYASQAHMVALQSGTPDDPGRWVTERRNVREDFRRFHGRTLDSIDAVAIMTDCDDRGVTAEAWYGTIRFLPDG